MAVRNSEEVVTLRLVGGNVTFVPTAVCGQPWSGWPTESPPRRWPLLRKSTPRPGRHVIHFDPFPVWVPSEVTALAREP